MVPGFLISGERKGFVRVALASTRRRFAEDSGVLGGFEDDMVRRRCRRWIEPEEFWRAGEM